MMKLSSSMYVSLIALTNQNQPWMEDEEGYTGFADPHEEDEEWREVKRSREDNAAGSPWHRFRLSLCVRLRTRKQGMGGGRGEEDRMPSHRLALERSATEISCQNSP
uniref:Uncharacterized protein n=1 Tax=Aegilops tauschii subsp. strangulata TaxID=200361 RepID=A0A453FZD9_AEGTS